MSADGGSALLSARRQQRAGIEYRLPDGMVCGGRRQGRALAMPSEGRLFLTLHPIWTRYFWKTTNKRDLPLPQPPYCRKEKAAIMEVGASSRRRDTDDAAKPATATAASPYRQRHLYRWRRRHWGDRRTAGGRMSDAACERPGASTRHSTGAFVRRSPAGALCLCRHCAGACAPACYAYRYSQRRRWWMGLAPGGLAATTLRGDDFLFRMVNA